MCINCDTVDGMMSYRMSICNDTNKPIAHFLGTVRVINEFIPIITEKFNISEENAKDKLLWLAFSLHKIYVELIVHDGSQHILISGKNKIDDDDFNLFLLKYLSNIYLKDDEIENHISPLRNFLNKFKIKINE